MIIQPCSERYHSATIRLICDTFKPPMLEEFPLLLGKSNMNHMWIAIDDEKVVAVVNFYVTPVILDGVMISVASIGAVATALSHRGKGLSSQLLHAAEKQMKLEGVDLVLISGDLPHYRRFGADQIGVMVQYEIPKSDSASQLMPYSDAFINELYTLYNQQKYRFYRSVHEMSELIKAALTPDPWWDTHVDMITVNNRIEGYLKYAIEHNHDIAFVHESIGKPEQLLKAVMSLHQLPSINHVYWELIDNDPLVPILDRLGYTKISHPLHHTSKIVNFNQLISRVHPLLSKHSKDFHIYYDENDSIYHFTIETITFSTKSLSIAQQLLFGPITDDLGLLDNQKEAFTKVLPLPFIFPNGLNYQ